MSSASRLKASDPPENKEHSGVADQDIRAIQNSFRLTYLLNHSILLTYYDSGGICVSRDLGKGDLTALVLAVLSNQSLHGYGIAREVKLLSDDALILKESALYPALRILEQDGMIEGQWQSQEKGADRKVYTITDKGIQEAHRRTEEWKNYTALIDRVLGKLAPRKRNRERMGHVQTA